MFRSVFLSLFIFPLFLSAQSKIGKTRDELKKELDTWKAGNASFFPKITEAGNTTTLSIKDPGYGAVRFVYTYDKNKVCTMEKTISINDSARTNYINGVLEQRGYEWKKLNGNQYVSKFSDKLMIEIPGSPKDHSFTIYKVDWTKEVYDMLYKK
jgi:hypothetical protein